MAVIFLKCGELFFSGSKRFIFLNLLELFAAELLNFIHAHIEDVPTRPDEVEAKSEQSLRDHFYAFLDAKVSIFSKVARGRAEGHS
jgi:hypothetical protein